MTATLRLPAPIAAADPKRIAATSLAIAVHAVVLMMLMVPMQVADPPAEPEQDMVVTPTPIVVPPIERVPIERPRPVTHERPQPSPPVHVEVINDDPRPVDPVVDAVSTDDGVVDPPPVVDNGPRFVQLSADIAPPPTYPPQAIRMQQSGRVVLRVLVGADGKPSQVEVEESSGFRLLDEAALKVVRKRWHFVPATRDGQAIEAWALAPVVFELRN